MAKANRKAMEELRAFDHGLGYFTGVSDLNPWTQRAMQRTYSSNSKTFWRCYDDTIEMMREFMHAADTTTFVPFPGPGRVVMDAVFNSFLEPGDKLLLVDNGYWGRYPEVMAKHYGFEVVRLERPVYRPADTEAVEQKLKEEKGIKAVHVVHVETELGILNPIKQIGEVVHRVAPDALYIVDSATAWPGHKLMMDEWGIDIDMFVSHKGFNAPSGLTFAAVNKRAMKSFDNRKTLPRSWYTSVQTWKDIWLECPDNSRHCLESFPNVILYAMRAKLDLMEQMGEGKYLKKYELASQAMSKGLRAMTEPVGFLIGPGPKCEDCPGCEAPDPNVTPNGKGRFCSHTDIGLIMPAGTNWNKVFEGLGDTYWIGCPHFGFGDERKDGYFLSGRGLRIGLVNDREHYPRNILAMICATGLTLRDAGVKEIRWEKGVEATSEILKRMRDELDWPYDEG